jgi:hypothetical protein
VVGERGDNGVEGLREGDEIGEPEVVVEESKEFVLDLLWAWPIY